MLRNAIKMQDPFIESAISLLPIVDELVILDMYSDDGTYKYLIQLKETFPDKIKLFQEHDVNTSWFEKLRIAANKAIRKSTKDYIFYIQADEIISEEFVDQIRDLPKEYSNANSFSFRRYQIEKWDWITKKRKVIRMAKNVKTVKTIKDVGTLNPIEPVIDTGIPFFHFRLFDIEKSYKYYAKKAPHVAGKVYNIIRNKGQIAGIKKGLKGKEYDYEVSFPKIMKGLQKYDDYVIRKELFDKDYLKEIYGRF